MSYRNKYCYSCSFFIFFNILLLYDISLVICVRFSTDSVLELPMLLKEGRQQLETLEANARSPASYGKCWLLAVNELKDGCKNLSEQSQGMLALRLTNCFLEMSGQPVVFCDEASDEIKKCLKRLDDRGFNAFTEFYTHTQNICYFLQSKLWHEETKSTIDQLASTSRKVTMQLKYAEKGQEALLEQQKEAINLQKTLASDIETSKTKLNSIMAELFEASEKQQISLKALLNQLNVLQSWILGEFSWFDSLIFYISSVFFVLIFTSSIRTVRARLPIFVIFGLNFIAEKILSYLIFDDESKETVVYLNHMHTSWVWLIRKFTVSLSILTFVVVSLSYVDYHKSNFKLLNDIKIQNEKILKIISAEHTNPKNILVKNGNGNNCSSPIPLLFTQTINNNVVDKTVLEKSEVIKIQTKGNHDRSESVISVAPSNSSNYSLRRSTRLLDKSVV